jgi:membrane protease YdiL (CAAX protease family)
VSRYSSRQLLLAKGALVVLVAVLAGPQLAKNPGENAVSVLSTFVLVALAVVAYEALSHTLALIVARIWGRHTVASRSQRDSPGRLRLRNVLTALGAYLGAQAVVWIVVATIAVLRVGIGATPETLRQVILSSMTVALPASLAAGCIAVLLVLQDWRKRLGPPVLAGILGLSSGSGRQIVTGLAGGALLSIMVLPLMSLVPDQPTVPDPVTQIVTSSASARWAWMLSAVLLAPPVEEVMFRGVLLGGLTTAWSARAATFIQGGIFWLLHAPEWGRWPAAVAIGLLTILVTALRLRTRSLGPSMAAHFAYNLVLAVMLASATSERGPSPRFDGPRWAHLPGGVSAPPALERRLWQEARPTL